MWHEWATVDFHVDILDKTLSDVHCPISLTLKQCHNHNYNTMHKAVSPSQIVHANRKVPNIKKEFKAKWDSEKQNEFKQNFSVDMIENVTIELNLFKPETVTQDDVDRITKNINTVYKESGSSSGMIKMLGNTKFFKHKLKKKSPNQPWFTRECAKGRKLLYSAKHKHRRIQSVVSESCFRRASKKYKKEIIKARKDFNKEIHIKLRNLKSSNPKEYWAILNDDKKTKIGNIAVETMFEHFKKLSSANETPSDDSQSGNEPTIESNLPFNSPFSEEELQKQTTKLKNGKASGLDSIINEFIKHSPSCMITLLTKYFNLILDSGIIPTDWGLGIIIPIYKNKGNTNDPDNYRGITLLSCIGKFFTMVVNTRLTDFLESNDLLGEEQAGFRAGYSTLDHIFSLHCLIDLYLNNKKRLYCAFIDYKKAFDMVDRCSLWQKLLSIGINGKILTIIKTMYANAKSCVQLDGDLSDFFTCNIGVRQGENLSPLLFSIFLNDLADFMSDKTKGVQLEYSAENLDCYIKLFVLLYADDTILISESPEDLQKMLDNLHGFCIKWKLHINASKTKIVIFSKGRLKNQPTWTLGTHNLEVTQDYVYLGVVLNYNGKFTKAIAKQINQARRASFSLIAKARKLDLPIDIHLHLFDSCILPILLYGSEVWGFSNLQKIETFYIQYLKHILKIGSRSINNIVLGELGRFKIERYTKQRMLNFWVHIVISKGSKISHAIYNKMRDLHNKGEFQSQWLSYIKATLVELNLEYLWQAHPENLNYNQMKNIFNEKLNYFYSELWRNEIEISSACDSYIQFKTEHHLEPYLTLLEPKYAIPISKFRCNNHRMPIVTGRYANINRLARVCALCNLGDVGDEYHYLLRCPYFCHQRKLFLKPEHICHANAKITMKHVLTSDNTEELIDLSKLIKHILDKFVEKS